MKLTGSVRSFALAKMYRLLRCDGRWQAESPRCIRADQWNRCPPHSASLYLRRNDQPVRAPLHSLDGRCRRSALARGTYFAAAWHVGWLRHNRAGVCQIGVCGAAGGAGDDVARPGHFGADRVSEGRIDAERSVPTTASATPASPSCVLRSFAVTSSRWADRPALGRMNIVATIRSSQAPDTAAFSILKTQADQVSSLQPGLVKEVICLRTPRQRQADQRETADRHPQPSQGACVPFLPDLECLGSPSPAAQRHLSMRGAPVLAASFRSPNAQLFMMP